MAAKIIYDNIKQKIDPYSAENMIVITTCPLNASGAPCSSRFNTSTISPLTGFYTSSNCGGNFGLSLKRAGYDAIIIVGKAGCIYCMSAKPILNNISKAYKKEFKYLDLSDLSKDDIEDFFKDIQNKGYDDENLKDKQVFSTPTVLITKDNKVVAYTSGSKEVNEYIDFLKKNKAIE